MKLFFTGFLQVFFVAVNTLFIAHLFYAGIVVSSFFISFLWSMNIRSVAFGGMKDRITYSVGAATGCITGVLFSQVFV